tara:strand:+ start:409 stop:735 length:327 start_codon:yes stop_codon:yes gene_type:complete
MWVDREIEEPEKEENSNGDRDEERVDYNTNDGAEAEQALEDKMGELLDPILVPRSEKGRSSINAVMRFLNSFVFLSSRELIIGQYSFFPRNVLIFLDAGSMRCCLFLL